MASINIRTLDLNLLRMLVAISDAKSVSKAGSQLGLSQPAASNALGRLRKAFDDPLFVRGRDGMLPTPVAKEILPGVRKHLFGLFATLGEDSNFDPRSSNRAFRISLSGLGEASFLPSLAIRVFKCGSGLRLFNVPSPLSTLSATLENGETDIAIGILDLNERGIRSTQLFEDTYIAISGAGLVAPPQSIPMLGKTRIIISAPAATYAKDIENTIVQNQLAENVVLRVGHFGALPELLEKLDVAAIVPGQVGKALQTAKLAQILPIKLKQAPGKVRMVWHDRTDSDAGCHWLRKQVVDLFGVATS